MKHFHYDQLTLKQTYKLINELIDDGITIQDIRFTRNTSSPTYKVNILGTPI